MPIRPKDPAKRGIRPVVRRPEQPTAPKTIVQGPAATTLAARAVPDDAIIVPRPTKRAHHKVDRTTDNWDEDGNHIVGKNRPPKHTQWKKGQSGNPAGPRRKAVVDPMTRLDQHILADFTVRQNGEEVTISMGEFAINLLKASAAKGVTKAQSLLLQVFVEALRRQTEAAGDTPVMLAWEQQALDGLLREFGLPPAPVIRADRDTGHDHGDRP